jgi:RNA 2',3'-cyclic 3'-phosphodiesterase
MRCFIAARPDEATRSRLDKLAAQLQRRFAGSRRMRAANLHLTLAFIGELSPAVASAAARAMQSLAFDPLVWTLDRVGHFPRARVVWVGGEDAALTELAARVRIALAAVQVGFDPKPFVAHVTVLRDLATHGAAHDAGATLDAIEPIRWRIERAEMMVSERDVAGAVRYRALHED